MGSGITQNIFMVQPQNETSDLYVSYWLKYPVDFFEKLRAGDEWRVVFRWKTPGSPNAEYSLLVSIIAYNGRAPQWQIRLHSPKYGFKTFEEEIDHEVPIGRWFKFQVFWHRSTGSDGRIWVAVDERVLIDRLGPNVGPDGLPIDRIFINPLYSGSAFPIEQWHDDVQIWSGFPTASPGDPWYDPPYAPH
jgi:hypothetical protein